MPAVSLSLRVGQVWIPVASGQWSSSAALFASQPSRAPSLARASDSHVMSAQPADSGDWSTGFAQTSQPLASDSGSS
ncbi:uncharacterized protein EHS24_005131 [Apiotrichum porosum]|uniref:Uncharacterized protein n=1 Tax=Apiotrichum porosum TaxID=105984 RepID=A0A427Y6X9_9TREE|nr:uncharacterized protein EHS24_005131 [Apiotrichum porosum]RSH86853.1 hypothetical protein EHS24_005131 [Apiotrichum porosum]